MPGIRINGASVNYGTRFATNISGDNNASMSVIINLAANDYVQPYLFVSSIMTLSGGSSTWNSFSGVLLN
jgi:thioester reductase-like protein